MGANCGHFSEPDVDAVCTNDAIGTGDTRSYSIPHFCTPDTSVGKSITEDYCSRIGGGTEWEYQGRGSSCSYNDCNNHQKVKAGCCKGCCGIVGREAHCKRKSYQGDPLQCCLQDYDGPLTKLGDNSRCFNPGDKSKTCLPGNRDITNSVCRDLVTPYCTGADLPEDDVSWLERWGTPEEDGSQSCIYALNRNLFGERANDISVLSGGPIDPKFFDSIDGFQWSRQLMSQAFDKYTTQGFEVGTLPGLNGYRPFQNTLFKICESVPGICEQALENTCVDQTTNRLLINQEKIPWCGCHMPDGEYQTYVDEFQVNKECTPICARAGNIKTVAPDGITPLDCKQDVCVIDNVTIDLAKVDVANGISFSQFCGGCSGSNANHQQGSRGKGSASCLCVISDLNIDAASSEIGGGINLRQHCGVDAQCFRSNPNNPTQQAQVSCDAPVSFDPFTEADQQQAQEDREGRLRFGIIAAIVVFGLLFLIILIWLLGRSGRKKTYKLDTSGQSKAKAKSIKVLHRTIRNRDRPRRTDGPRLNGLIRDNHVVPKDTGRSITGRT